ncbi:hypothetical protein V6N11_017442 [Hibiscus sabdariffa]|uniref:S-protein homolog n=1 Tax=Hibiscus sabdariffa TaxID=183260 RepID=A0ABR2TYR4_9ROSI
MNPWQIKWVRLLSLTLILLGSEGKDDVWDFLVSRTTVVIKNNVQPETYLTVHCKSEDDDLKAHVLPYNGYFKFDFIPSAFKRTLFYCRMEWNGKSHWFDASQKVTKACKGFVGPDEDWPSSAKAEGSLTAGPTHQAGTKVGLIDPTVPSGRAVAQRIKVTLGITC